MRSDVHRVCKPRRLLVDGQQVLVHKPGVHQLDDNVH